TLRTVGPLTFVAELGLVGADEPLVPGRVVLLNSSRHTTLVPISIEQLGSATYEGKPIAAGLTAAKGPKSASPGIPVEVTFQVSGKMPAGTTRGKLEVRSPQLEEPVVVDYEVLARYSSAWIVPCFLVFGFLGWFLRVYMRKRTARDALRIQAG